MQESVSTDAQTAEVTRAAGHLQLLRAYFGLQIIGGLVGGGLVLLSPIIGPTVTIRGDSRLLFPLIVVTTWAAFKARRLLAKRDRDGLWMAGVAFACNLSAAAAAHEFDSGVVYSALGILITINVYRHRRELGF